jgi:DNA-binding transcriptional MerR regulator
VKKPREKKASSGRQEQPVVALLAFSVDHAATITGLSKARLTRWDQLGFFSPELADPEDKGNPYARVYSYTDLVGLRTLAVLADKHRVPLKELRKAYDVLSQHTNKPWSQMQLSVLNRKVVFDLGGAPRDTEGQLAGKHVPLPTIASEVARRAEALRKRDDNQIGVFERHKFIAHNARVLAGTRIPVSAVASFIEAGYSDAAIVAEYPTLTKFDVAMVRNHMKEAA